MPNEDGPMPEVAASDSRKGLTFEQAEGAAALPAQLQLKEVSQELRAGLWAALFAEVSQGVVHPTMGGWPWFNDTWKKILQDKHVYRDHLMLDEFPPVEAVLSSLKATMVHGSYIEIFGLLQWIIRHRECPRLFPHRIEQALVRARSPYRVVERTIMPLTSEAEAKAVELLFANPSAREFNGARVHLGLAGENLTGGEWAGSIRESVHAVEAVVRLLEPGCKLDDALVRLEKAGKIHPALKRGFSSLYGFTSDEQGIRHPLLEKNAAEIDETDALYMFGACAAFITYLIGKGRKANVLPET